MSGIAALCLALVTSLEAEAFRLLTIGDSLSKEYKYEVSFTVPDSELAAANPEANVLNWPELLTQFRSTEFFMGEVKTFLDFRVVGREYNYSIPGSKAEFWSDFFLRQYSVLELFNAANLAAFNSRLEIRGDLSAVHAVLIFVGGNDLSLTNGEAKNDEIRQYLANIHSWVRNNGPANLPIIIATVPDIGATPAERISDPATAAAARQRVAILNTNIAALGSLPDTYVARIDAITDRIFDQVPFHINGTEFINGSDSENPPLYLFCKDGFHPAMAAQALIANEILKAINSIAPATTRIPLFTNREILTIIGQNPDQPYLDWAGSSGGMLENPDGDALPNLVEYLLATSPTQGNAGFSFLPGGEATFTPSSEALRFADLSVMQSATLDNDWIQVPATSIQSFPDGSTKILPTAPKLFYKFQATPKP